MPRHQQPLHAINLLNQQLDVDFALRAAGLGIWELDPVTQLVQWDDRCRQLFGLTGDRPLPYEEAIRCIHPDDVDRVDQAVQWAMNPQSGGHYDVTYRTIGADDREVRWVRFMGKSYFHPGGQVYRFAGVAQEVTQQMWDQQALQEAKARQTYLLTLSDRLRWLSDPIQIQYQAACLLGELLGANRVGYAQTQNDKALVAVTCNYTQGVPGIEGVYRYEEYGPDLLKSMQAGQTVVRADIAGSPALNAAEKKAHAVLQLGATLNVPLVKEGQLVAILFVHYQEAHAFTEHEVGLVQETAERIWAAVEQARAEEALRQSEAKFRRLSESGLVAVAFFEIGGSIVEANDAFLAMLGVSRDELNSQKVRWDVYTAPAWMTRTRQAIAEFKKTGSIRPYEKQFYHTSGELRWGIFAGATLGDGKTGVSLVVDITQRKLAEEAVQESKERYSTLLENLPDYAIFRLNPDGIITEWTIGAERVTGYSAQEMVGCHVSLGYPPEELAVGQPEKELQEAIRTGRAEREFIRVRKNGEHFWVNEITTAIRDGHGQLTGFTKISRDISRRKRAQQRRLQLEERTRLALEAADMATWEWHLPTDAMFWNEPLFRLLGMSAQPEPQPSDAFLSRIHPQDQPWVRSALARAVEEQGLFDVEFRVVAADGPTRWLSGYGRITGQESGLPTQMSGVMFDITDRKLAVEALREVDRRKDEFLALLAHELRNPITTLSNALMLLEATGGEDEQLPLASIQPMMRRELTHLVRLIDDLLDISRINRGKIELRRQRLDLTKLVNEVTTTMQPLIEQAHQQLMTHLPSQSVDIEGDADRLRQVLRNLLGNAIKFTPAGGRLVVSLQPIAGEACLRVVDTGIGLAEQDLTRIFDMFAQVDASRTRSQGGLGLGLTLVQELVHLHDGRIEAHSEGLGRGSEFILYLPLSVSPSINSL
ncbi:PAS domain S-box protein [Spirosoma koreense]